MNACVSVRRRDTGAQYASLAVGTFNTGQPWRFTGMRESSVMGGILDYNARYYDPVIGRFLSADTIVGSLSIVV
jgi:RHS repeat-associated protein